MFIYSPLEQFRILPITNFLGFFTITNQTIFLVLVVFFLFTLYYSLLKPSTQTLYIKPTRWQSILEIVYDMILSMVKDTITGKRGEAFFPLIFTIFFFLLLL